MKRYLSMGEVAARAQTRGKKLAESTIRTYRAKNLAGIPAPDVIVGLSPGWLPETIDPWIDRLPGSGRRRGLTSQ